MSLSDLLGAMLQSEMTPSSKKRVEAAMGKKQGGLLESLGGLAGGEGKDLGGMLGEVLAQASKVAGGKQNLALGGLGALAGALLGGGGKSMGGALGGGAMALLGAMAFKALQGRRQGAEKVPAGLLEPQTVEDRLELEQQTELVLKAMINAAKADGQIDEKEIQRIIGKLQEAGADQEDQNYVLAEMQKPQVTGELIDAVNGRMEVAAQVYAASLMAIEVDTPAEKAYLAQLASGLGLSPDITRRIEEMVGLAPA